MSKDVELYMLKPESLEVVIDRLTDFAKKDDVTINAFYFLYGYGKLLDNVTNGNELYDYFQKKSTDFLYCDLSTMVDFVEQTKGCYDLYEIGKRLVASMRWKEIGSIFYNNYHKDELVKIFNEELF